MARLTLEDFSDRELLFALEEHADSDGTVSSGALAEGLGLSSENGLKHPVQNVAVRLTWLKRFGVVYRSEETRRWGLTSAGYAALHGGLRVREERALAEFDDDSLFRAVELMGARMLNVRSAETATLAQRQWRYALAQRKRRLS